MSFDVMWDKPFSLVNDVWYRVTVTVNSHSISDDPLRTNKTHVIYTVPQQADGSAPSCTVYEFRVLAMNPAGSSLPSSAINQTVLTGDDEQVCDDDSIE